ncbi:hypothetical protein Scep_017491 [Stephania cephalantha]|uniref:Uncharacterized protein n=1 Tax=Stephania cephalantha TaxID=152367 RepID=A0AAP0IPL0_9MAGN
MEKLARSNGVAHDCYGRNVSEGYSRHEIYSRPKLADMAQSHEMNMAHILELMQQGNTGAAERAPERHGPNPPLAPIHEDHPAEKLSRSPTALELCLYFHTKDHEGGQRRHAIAGGAGGGDGCGSSGPISSPNEPIKLLRRDFLEMQTHILWVMQDHTLTQDQLQEVEGQLRRMEHALMDRLGISFMPTPPRDVQSDDSETNDDLDD